MSGTTRTPQYHRFPNPKARLICAIALFTAASIASSYALVSIPNVNLLDFLVFLAGYLYGFLPGTIVACISWLIYGTFNPYGFNVGILVACALSETIYSAIGCISRRISHEGVEFAIEISLLAAVATLIYDLLTNISFMLVFHVKPILALISALPFTAIHLLSNVTIFFIASHLVNKLKSSFKSTTYKLL